VESAALAEASHEPGSPLGFVAPNSPGLKRTLGRMAPGASAVLQVGDRTRSVPVTLAVGHDGVLVSIDEHQEQYPSMAEALTGLLPDDARVRVASISRPDARTAQAGVTSMRAQEAQGGTRAMLALYPQDPASLALDGGESPEALHVTVALIDLSDVPAALPILAGIGEEAMTGPARINGIARFATNPETGTVPIVALIDSPALDDTRPALVAAFDEAGTGYAQDYTYTPHLTLAYVPEEQASQVIDLLGPLVGQYILLDQLRLVQGDSVLWPTDPDPAITEAAMIINATVAEALACGHPDPEALAYQILAQLAKDPVAGPLIESEIHAHTRRGKHGLIQVRSYTDKRHTAPAPVTAAFLTHANPADESAETRDRFGRRNPDGSTDYHPDRKALHAKIIAAHLHGVHAQPEGERHALFTAGGSASGKSSVVTKDARVHKPGNAVVVDPDRIKAMLPEYRAMVKKGDLGAAAKAHEESSDIAKAVTHAARQHGMNLVVDGTGNGEPGKFGKKVGESLDHGYKTSVAYVNVPTDEAITRAKKRAEGSGRMVPVEHIKAIHKHVSTNLPSVMEHADRLHHVDVFDNNVAKGEQAIHVAALKGGKLHAHDPERLAAFHAKAHE
jgi:predicted ABC-type ATPase/2'-5' RNA ligase